MSRRGGRVSAGNAGSVEGLKGSGLHRGEVIGGVEQIDALRGPEGEVGRSAGDRYLFSMRSGDRDAMFRGGVDLGVPGLTGNSEAGGKVGRAHEDGVDAGHAAKFLDALDGFGSFDLNHQAKLVIKLLLAFRGWFGNTEINRAGDAEEAAHSLRRKAGVRDQGLQHLGRIGHGEVENIGAALRRFEDCFASEIGNSDHGQHAPGGRHAAKIRRLSEGEEGVLHLDPRGGIAHVMGHLEELGRVGVAGGAENGTAAGFLKRSLKSIQGRREGGRHRGPAPIGVSISLARRWDFRPYASP